jgi:hypothetical protein
VNVRRLALLATCALLSTGAAAANDTREVRDDTGTPVRVPADNCRIVSLARHRQVQVDHSPPDHREDGRADLGEDRGVGRHDQVLVGRAAIAEVKAHLHVGHLRPDAQGFLALGPVGLDEEIEARHDDRSVPSAGRVRSANRCGYTSGPVTCRRRVSPNST